MKNEVKILPRMLSSILPIIDGCVCIDTGSDDESKKIVHDFFEKHNLPCEIYDHPFIDFEDARNFALQKLINSSHVTIDDFGYWIDCDEQLIISPEFKIEQFKKQLSNCDIATTLVNYGNSRYARRNLFRIPPKENPYNLRWHGKVHEILLCDSNKVNNLTGLEVLVNADGHSWGNITEKYLKHAEILEQEVEKNNDPRDVFYLAQSYKDAGETKKAIEWYTKRAQLNNGFYEERYYAQFMLGILTGDIFEYMKCSELEQLRAEHILNIIVELQNRQLWHTAYIFSKYAIENYHQKNPYPQRVLFLDEDVYSKRLLNCHIENCNRINKKEEVAKLMDFDSIDKFFDFIPSAWKEHREFSEWLVNQIKPDITVELGIDYGYSLFCFAVAKKGIVYGIDNFNGDRFTGIRNTYDNVLHSLRYLEHNYGINNIEIIKGNFNDIYGYWNKKIDILHIDGLPIYGEIKKDYQAWSKFVSDNGVVLVHNTQYYAEIKKFFKEVDLPKYEFRNGSGLGIISQSNKIIESIKEKYDPDYKEDSITIGYIAHDYSVYEKYLKPSIENLRGKFNKIFTDDQLKPAQNYNDLIDRCKTKYLLLVHEDVTFSPDLLENIHKTIYLKPDFGALGAVGTDNTGKYHWGESSVIKEIEKLDCCCILINKEHNIKFDYETFDDFHLYVEDYCMQAIKKGLKIYTFFANASEAEKNSVYNAQEQNYFKHHSVTMNQRGYCWGRWNEYKDKLENKWKYNGVKNPSYSIRDGENVLVGGDIYENGKHIGHADDRGDKGELGPTGMNKKTEIDICIISYAKTSELKEVTEKGIQTLLESENHNKIKFNVFVVESNKEVNYDHFINTKTIYTNEKFGYNRYLNIAIKHGNSKYVALCNNDLSYEKNWASNIIKEMECDNDLVSASPFCPQVNPAPLKNTGNYYGYTIREHLAGWCIMIKRNIFNIIGQLNEDFLFWYADNSFSEDLKKHNLKHCLVSNSVVHHHDKSLGKVSSEVLNENEKYELTYGQEKVFKMTYNK